MRFARPERAFLLLMLAAAPAMAGGRALPPLAVLELPAAAPLIDAEIAGQKVRLTVDFGGDDIVQINPGTALAATLSGDTRPDGKPVDRGVYRVAVGQTTLAIRFSREILLIGGRPVKARVLRPEQVAGQQPAGSDGSIGLPLLPHAGVILRRRPATPQDRRVDLPARIGRSDAWGFDWPMADGTGLDVELHPQRPVTVASAAAASLLAQQGSGHLDGPVRRIQIAFGATRPVRWLQLDRPVAIGGLSVRGTEVRLFDWAGKSELPPEADPENAAMTVVGRRGRQRGWPVLKLGADVLDACASISWQPQPKLWQLVCPNI